MQNKTQKFGKYIVHEQLGRGGMGIVFKAYDTVMRRFVALKLISDIEQQDFHRFVNESQSMVKLNHPNIVRFYEFGMTPRPHYTMEYIEGETLAHLIKEKLLEVNALVDILAKVCDALHSAHSNSIIHRDVKPANIMIDKNGEPKLMDFGLAKNDEQSQKLTASQAIIGTIHYMAPEQVTGIATLQSDLYAIGAILYEGLTYRTLFQGNSNVNIMVQIMESFPIAPRQLNPDVSPYLEAICLKCLCKKPQKRYLNARQLAKEFRNFRENRSIIAKKFTKFDQILQLVQHNKVLFVFIAIIVIFSLSFALYFVWKEQQLRDAFRQVEMEKIVAQKAQKHTESFSKELLSLNTAMIESLNYVSTTTKYSGILSDQSFIRPIRQVFEQSVRLQNAEEYRYLRAIVFSEVGNEKQQKIALQDFTKTITQNPNDAIAYTNRGTLHFRLKQYQKAIVDFNSAISLQPGYGAAYLGRAMVYDEQKHYSLALNDYNQAVYHNPTLENAYLHRGNIYKDQLKKYDLAYENYQRFIQLAPHKEEGYVNIAVLYEKSQHYDEAFEVYSRLLRMLPKSSLGYHYRGNLYLKVKKYQQALRDYNKALIISPERKIVYHNRSIINKRLGKTNDALADINKFITAYTNYASAYYNRGNLHRDLHNDTKAIDDYNKAISLNATYREAYANRGIVYQRIGKQKLALYDYQKAISLGYNNEDLMKKYEYLRRILNKK